MSAAPSPARQPKDLGIPPGTCPCCGFIGDHPRPGDCITALRDRIAVLEFVGAKTGRKPNALTG